MPFLVLYYPASGDYLDRARIDLPMNTDPGQEEKWQALRRRLSYIWVVWGLFPLGIMFVLMLALASPEASANTSTTDQQESLRTERRTQAVLAVSALLFFVGFTLDGRWTDAERVGRRTLRAAGGDDFKPTRSQLATHADVALDAVNRSVNMLTAIGLVMAVLAVVGVAAILPLVSGLHLLVLAAIFQLFVVSRHPYYSELVEAAISGELPDLEAEDDNKKKK